MKEAAQEVRLERPADGPRWTVARSHERSLVKAMCGKEGDLNRVGCGGLKAEGKDFDVTVSRPRRGRPRCAKIDGTDRLQCCLQRRGGIMVWRWLGHVDLPSSHQRTPHTQMLVTLAGPPGLKASTSLQHCHRARLPLCHNLWSTTVLSPMSPLLHSLSCCRGNHPICYCWPVACKVWGFITLAVAVLLHPKRLGFSLIVPKDSFLSRMHWLFQRSSQRSLPWLSLHQRKQSDLNEKRRPGTCKCLPFTRMSDSDHAFINAVVKGVGGFGRSHRDQTMPGAGLLDVQKYAHDPFLLAYVIDVSHEFQCKYLLQVPLVTL